MRRRIAALAAACILTATSAATAAGAQWASWGKISHTGTLSTAHVWGNHQSVCGRPIGHQAWDGDTVSQRFAKCTVHGSFTIARVGQPTPTPRPTVTPTSRPFPPPPPPPPPVATATALPPTATATASPPATALPATSTPGGGTLEQLVAALINRDRAAVGVSPVTEVPAQDICSQAHSIHMAQVGSISHDQFPGDICVAHTYAGENVGESGGDPAAALTSLHHLMMAEPHDAATCSAGGNHACNIISPRYQYVGVGIYVVGDGTVWLTEDFYSDSYRRSQCSCY